MKNLLAGVAALVITVLVLGFALGWFQVGAWSHHSTGQTSVNVNINTKKMGEDLQKGGAKLQKVLEKATHEESEDPPSK